MTTKQPNRNIITNLQIQPIDLFELIKSKMERDIRNYKKQMEYDSPTVRVFPLTIGYMDTIENQLKKTEHQYKIYMKLAIKSNQYFITRIERAYITRTNIYNLCIEYINLTGFKMNFVEDLDNLDFELLRKIYKRKHMPMLQQVHEELLAVVLDPENISYWKDQIETYDMFENV